MTASSLEGRWFSSLSLAHEALWQAQEDNGGALDVKLAEVKLQTTPGITFAPGTTFVDVFLMLKDCRFIDFNRDSEEIRVLPW